MKKLIPLLALVVGAITGYSQQVNFNNNITSPLQLVTWESDGRGVVGTNYVAILLYGTSDSSLRAHTSFARFRVTTTGSPGTWSGGNRTLTGFNFQPGNVARLQVQVFDNRAFNTYDAALQGGGILGESTIFDYTIPSIPPGAGTDTMVNFRAFTLVPEPSVIGLGLIGAGALFMLRRRK